MKQTDVKSLNDVCELIIDCEHKTALTQETGYPSIRTPNIGKGRLILENVNRVSEETYKEWTKRAIPQAEDLILAREAPVGNVAIIPKNLKVCLGQRTVLIRANKEKVNPRFLVYLLLGDEIQGKIKSRSNGATVHHFNMKDIRNLELPELPPIETQRKIASTLSNYDDLIENNTRRIEILEQMAKLIYEEWFVKFRFPGHESVKMVPSDLGEIPEGWEIRKIKDIAEITKGMSYKSENLVDEGGCAFVNLKCINRGGGFRYEGLKRFEGKFKERHVVNKDDIVIAVTDMTQNREIIARPARVPKINEETILISMDLVKITPKNNDFKTWLYGLLKYSQFGETLKDFANGVNVLHLSTENMLEYTFPLPDSKLINKYTETICNFYKIVDNFELKNQNLRKTRDLLLPKLISGKIDVSDLDIRIRNEFQES
jgi:type I restriction enzyme, S subunit